MKSIAIISHSSNLNGAERCLVETVKVLYQSKRYDRIVVYLPYDGKLRSYLEPYSEVRIAYIPWWISNRKYTFKEKIKLSKQLIKSSISLSKEFAREKYTSVLTNTIATPVAALAAKIVHVPHIWFIHELGQLDHGYGYGYGYGYNLSYMLMNLCSQKFIVNSKYVKDFYQDKLKRPLQIVYQPVDVNVNKYISATDVDTLRLIIIGRVAEGKGQSFAIDVVNKMRAKGKKVSLLIIGANNSNESRQIRMQVESCDYIGVYDFADDISYYYSQADVALVCSRAEAFGRITIEAMKYGLPVIASNVGGNVELIKDGETGLLYEYGSIQSMEEKIDMLFDVNFRQCISKQAYDWAWKNMTLDSYKKQIEEIL